MNECEFCSLMGKEENRVYEDDKSAAVLYPKPAVLGHIIVFAKEHTTIIEQTPDYIVAHLAKIANRISTALFDALKSQGTNIIIANGLAAGQTTPHFAINIIPRLVNDGLSFNWQPRQVKEEAMDTIELQLKEETKNIGSFEKEKKAPIEEKEAEKIDEKEEDYALKQLKRIP